MNQKYTITHFGIFLTNWSTGYKRMLLSSKSKYLYNCSTLESTCFTQTVKRTTLLLSPHTNTGKNLWFMDCPGLFSFHSQHRPTPVSLCHFGLAINTKRKSKKSIYHCLIKWEKCFQLYYNSIRKDFRTDEMVKWSYSAAILTIRGFLFWRWKPFLGQ